MEKRLLRLANLVESIEDLDYIEFIDDEERAFIFDKKTGAITPTDKIEFIISLKKLAASYEDEIKEDHYFSAVLEGKKVAARKDPELFREFVEVATNPVNFNNTYNDYYDSITDISESIYRVRVENRSNKVKVK